MVFGFLSPSQAPPSPQSSANHGLNNRISPSILLIIIIIAVIFFISGILHLLVRFLIRPAAAAAAARNSDEIEDLSALQGQLQQLFHLHDSGVDQSFIDALPVFNYKAIIGADKDPFDCAVCLSEFEVEDELRLLPKCSHAFHVDCIDTWLLSHSTCPICRGNILLQDSSRGAASPAAAGALESQDSREIVEERRVDLGVPEIGDRVVEVKLGKFRNVGGGAAADGGAEARRCFSMGSFAYVMKEDSSLRVAIADRVKKRGLGHERRTAMSECGCDSMRGFEAFKVVGARGGAADGGNDSDRSSVCMSKRESFSWLKSGRKDEMDFDEEIGTSLDGDHTYVGRNLHWHFHTTFSSND
ncbi:RING-H2 finger protein ATL13-like [Salvia miltiorrhiza]|uniref:RING-H2 finger protein ATL13-like n=1 Tax=Salvia miltiorrhiza TaxID=226208 RepID=UPI0025ABAC42|nr:RING-H2 finger protein ATL13-like [Salvia miltiorrhiza]